MVVAAAIGSLHLAFVDDPGCSISSGDWAGYEDPAFTGWVLVRPRGPTWEVVLHPLWPPAEKPAIFLPDSPPGEAWIIAVKDMPPGRNGKPPGQTILYLSADAGETWTLASSRPSSAGMALVPDPAAVRRLPSVALPELGERVGIPSGFYGGPAVAATAPSCTLKLPAVESTGGPPRRYTLSGEWFGGLLRFTSPVHDSGYVVGPGPELAFGVPLPGWFDLEVVEQPKPTCPGALPPAVPLCRERLRIDRPRMVFRFDGQRVGPA